MSGRPIAVCCAVKHLVCDYGTVLRCALFMKNRPENHNQKTHQNIAQRDMRHGGNPIHTLITTSWGAERDERARLIDVKIDGAQRERKANHHLACRSSSFRLLRETTSTHNALSGPAPATCCCSAAVSDRHDVCARCFTPAAQRQDFRLHHLSVPCAPSPFSGAP